MGQVMGILGPLILLGAGALAIIHRCDWLQICGNPFQSAGAVSDSSSSSSSSSPDSADTNNDGTVSTNEDSASKVNTVGTSMKKGCCECYKENNGDVRCSRNGSQYTRYASAPQDMSKAMSICYGGCSSSNGGKLTSNQAVRCPSGYASINGKCQRITSSSKGAPTGNKGSSSSSGSGTIVKPTPKGGPVPACPKGTITTPQGCARANYATTTFYTVGGKYGGSNIRPYPLYHRLAN